MRKLVSVRQIDSVLPIPGADAIEAVVIGGWTCVSKKGEFEAGDHCLFFEIDSILPADNTMFKFLTDKSSKTYDGELGPIVGHRLRTIKLRGQVSQGLALPIPYWIRLDTVDGKEVIHVHSHGTYGIDDDLSHVFGVEKYERPIPTNLAGMIRGNYPSWLPKTDLERVENLRPKNFVSGYYEVEEKVEGTSFTVYWDGETSGVTSRNVDLKLDQEGNLYVDFAKSSGLLDSIEAIAHLFTGDNSTPVALRGELIGPGIQGNIYQLQDHHMLIFDIYVGGIGYLPSHKVRETWGQLDSANLSKNIGLVPYLGVTHITPDDLLDFSETFATGVTQVSQNGVLREGIVLKHSADSNIRFKSISRQYLLKND